MSGDVVFSRTTSVAEFIERSIQGSAHSLDVALYRLNHLRLAEALGERKERGVLVRLVLDRGKYEGDPTTRRIVAAHRIPFRLARGRRGPGSPGSPGSKMHHKFAILDDRIVLTGSYNWTEESEQENCENLLLVREPNLVQKYQEEFEGLWEEADQST